jgi:hypothetical protein
MQKPPLTNAWTPSPAGDRTPGHVVGEPRIEVVRTPHLRPKTDPLAARGSRVIEGRSFQPAATAAVAALHARAPECEFLDGVVSGSGPG